MPGLPLLSLIEVEKVTSKAVCEAGRKPVAESNVLGRCLGPRQAGHAHRRRHRREVQVPGVGEVTARPVEDADHVAYAPRPPRCELKVSVNPLKLNVADVKGEVTLAEATCETPKGARPDEVGGRHRRRPATAVRAAAPMAEQRGGDGGTTGGDNGDGGTTGGDNGDGGTEVKPQTGTGHAPAAVDTSLAETGGSSTTPYIAGGAALLLALGAGAMVVARRRGAQD